MRAKTSRVAMRCSASTFSSSIERTTRSISSAICCVEANSAVDGSVLYRQLVLLGVGALVEQVLEEQRVLEQALEGLAEADRETALARHRRLLLEPLLRQLDHQLVSAP